MKNFMNSLKKINIQYIFYSIFFILYFYFICSQSRSYGINSDIANHMLQAQDFLSGNVLMKGWCFTGITFLTTDLFFYEIAELFCDGINWKSYYFATALMIFFIFLSYSFLVFKNIKKNIFHIVLFIFLSSIFIPVYFIYMRVHSGALCYTFIVFILFSDIFLNNIENVGIIDKKIIRIKFILFLLFIFLGSFGDFLFFIECICPIFIYIVFSLFQSIDKNKIISNVKLFLSILTSIFIAFVLDKIYFILNGSDKHSYINEKHFLGISGLYDNFVIFLNHLLGLTYSSYWEHNVTNLLTYVKIINFIILIIGIILLFYILIKYFFSIRTVDNLSVLLSLSVVFVGFANIFTDMNQLRYLILIPLALNGLIIRNFDDICCLFKNKKAFTIFFIILCLFSFIGKLNTLDCKNFNKQTEEMKELVIFLKEKKLFNGFSSFWRSSVFTVLSEGKVKIRHLNCIENNFYQSDWFCKDDWYNENTNFILFDLSKNTDSFKEDEVKKYFGVPKAIYYKKNYVIFVYDKNLASFIIDNHNYQSKLFILPLERFYFNKNVKKNIKANKLVLSKGGIVFGPYINLANGKYLVTIYGKNLLFADFDIYSSVISIKKSLNYKVLNIRDNKIDLLLDLKDLPKNKIRDIEFRSFNNRESMVEFDHVEVNSYGK